MKKIIQKSFCIIGMIISILTALYIGLSVYYRDGFTVGTWVNAVYCTGKTVEQVNAELMEQDTYDEITLVLPDGRKENVRLENVGYQIDYTMPLSEIRERQNPWHWYKNLSVTSFENQILPLAFLDKGRLEEVLSQMSFVQERKADEEYDVYLKKTESGYVLFNEREQVLDYDACKAVIEEAILQRQEQVVLAEMGCYKDLPLNFEMKKTLELWERVSEFQNCEIVYSFGEEKVSIDASVAAEWFMISDGKFQTDENGEFLVDKEKLEAYVDSLADKFDTLGTTRTFQATRGDAVSITGGTYGNRIDRKAEKEYLYQAFLERRQEVREPVYLNEGWKKGLDDIGNTYIEVDMGEQHLYYYRDSELVLEAPIVTGNVRRGHDTPAMVCYVYGKQKNRVLRGPGYASPVKFWMPVKGGIGIHDARWRKEFGGDIYLTDGSHGCINMPLEKAEELYEQIEIGTPVVMFY